MKAITVRQPWASAIIHGGKGVENRTTNIVGAYRGPLAIVAGKTKADATRAPQFPMLLDLSRRKVGYPLVFGAIIGVVDLVDVHHGPEWGGGCHKYQSPVPVLPDYSLCSPWGESGVLHLVLRNPRPLEPITHTGFLGCRELPADVVAQIEEQLR